MLEIPPCCCCCRLGTYPPSLSIEAQLRRCVGHYLERSARVWGRQGGGVTHLGSPALTLWALGEHLRRFRGFTGVGMGRVHLSWVVRALVSWQAGCLLTGYLPLSRHGCGVLRLHHFCAVRIPRSPR